MPRKKSFQSKPELSPSLQLRELRFRKNRNGNAVVSAQVLMNDAWHEISLKTDEAGFRKLRRLDEDDRKLLLDSLVTLSLPTIPGEVKRPRGPNTKKLMKAQFIARWLGPPLLEWARKWDQNDPLLLRVLRQLSKDRPHVINIRDPFLVATYLIERNWRNAGEEWPKAPLPKDNPEQFFKVLKRKDIKPNTTKWTRKTAREHIKKALEARATIPDADKFPLKPLDDLVNRFLKSNEPRMNRLQLLPKPIEEIIKDILDGQTYIITPVTNT